MAQRLFGEWGAAGGHKSAARAEIPLDEIRSKLPHLTEMKQFVMDKIKGM